MRMAEAPRERPLLVPEKFAFQKSFRNRRTVHFDEARSPGRSGRE